MIQPGLLSVRDAAELNRRLERLEALAIAQAVPPLTLAKTVGGTILFPGLVTVPFFARITAAPPAGSGAGSGCTGSGSGAFSGAGGLACLGYSWIEVVRVGCDWLTLSGGRSGTACLWSAFELNDNLLVPVGTRVQLWPAKDGRSYVFQSERGRFVTDVTCDGANPVLHYD